jgi:hypothetical protein
MTDIFISVGRISTRGEEVFLRAVDDLLKSHGLNPRTVGRTDFVDKNPVRKVLDVMKDCSGIIVIASERMAFELGFEFPNSDLQVELQHISLPTVWIQIETAMAYALGLPLLLLTESNLREDGFLEGGHDWSILRREALIPECLTTAEFQRHFKKWSTEAVEFDRKNKHIV